MVLASSVLPTHGQIYRDNIFENNADIGSCSPGGGLVFDNETQTYIISGTGDNIWFGEDQFRFAWIEIDDNFILRANVKFLGEGSHPHRKTGLMIRNSLDPASGQISAVVHGDGLTSLQYRLSQGEDMSEKRCPVNHPDVIQLERQGDMFIFSFAGSGEPFDTVTFRTDKLGGKVYAGIFICSHDNNVVESAEFSNFRLIRPAGPDLVPYHDYLASNLEILDVSTGLRRVVLQSDKSIQAPNWTPDGRYLIYNSEGLLYRYDIAMGTSEPLNTGSAVNNNNDHVLSFDGTMLGISNHLPAEGGYSYIFILPTGGGEPERITAKGPSYLHGWSPDKNFLVYTAERNKNFDIYKIAIDRKEEIRLTDAEGLDDGSEYTPDGNFIYFNSVRSGTMQLWRMKPDGKDQEQITDDEFNNWFPHISPDGGSVVFLSFGREVPPGDHPFYKNVYIRIISKEGGQPRVLAYVYGGQGTINVPSWSPDGKRIAFVSNTGSENRESSELK